MNYVSLLFGFRGRIGRMWYWIGTIILAGAGSALQLITGPLLQTVSRPVGIMWDGVEMTVPFVCVPLSNPVNLAVVVVVVVVVVNVIVAAILGYVALRLHTKRWRDRGKSGWWMPIGLIPLVGAVWLLVECGLLRGTTGANLFGADPAAAPAGEPPAA